MEKKELRKKSEEHAETNKIKLNPNDKMVDTIFTGLLKNKEKHGEVYCPCRVITGDKEKDKEIVCPCIFHMQEIKNMNHCKCNLFVGKEK